MTSRLRHICAALLSPPGCSSSTAAAPTPAAGPAAVAAAPAAAGARGVARDDDADYELFRRHGFLELGKILSDAELEACRELFDRNCRDHAASWTENTIWQSWHLDALITAPELDEMIVRHPIVMNAVRKLMGGTVCFSELQLRQMEPLDELRRDAPGLANVTSWELDGNGREVGRRWHRDGGTSPKFLWDAHPLKMGFIQLVVYLEDVDEGTHSFAISPHSVDEPLLPDYDAQLARNGAVELRGVAGTAALFNVSRLHTVSIRPTAATRKTFQICESAVVTFRAASRSNTGVRWEQTTAIGTDQTGSKNGARR
jgi:hypothetical protein